MAGSFQAVYFKPAHARRARTDLGFTQGVDLASSGTAPLASGALVTNDVTVLATAQTTSTGTMTPTRVDTATAGTATGAITADATDATMAANIQAGIRALGGIYADATCVPGTADTFIITVFGGYDVTWATTFTSPTITESGSAGGTTAVPGSVRYRGFIPVRGNLAEVKRVRFKGFADNSLDVSIKDAGNRSVCVLTGIDTWTSPNDVPYVRVLCTDGRQASDGAATNPAQSGVFDAPFQVDVTTSAPITAGTGFGAQSPPLTAGGTGRDGAFVELIIKSPYAAPGKRFLKRSSGAIAAPASTATTFNLGEEYAVVKGITLRASSDTTVAPTITDADGFTVYNQTATDFTAGVVARTLTTAGTQSHDQGGTAVSTADVVVHSPLSVSLTGLGAGTFTVETIVEV